jgi:hypothetical protein
VSKKCERVLHAAHMKFEGNSQNCRARQPPHALSRLAFAKGSLEHLLIKDPTGFHQLIPEVLNIQDSSLCKVVTDSDPPYL